MEWQRRPSRRQTDPEANGWPQLITLCRTAQRGCALLFVCLALHTAAANAAGPRRHFDLEAGDASLMLNEFSRQSDLQVLFDFNLLRGMKTHAVSGDLDASTALTSMLAGTNLVFDFVNDHTLTVTPGKASFFSRLWHRSSLQTVSERALGHDDGLEQVLISGSAASGTQPLLGAQTIQYNRAEIDRSGLATPEDFLRTMPQVFGGGPTQDTVLGREAASNSAHGSGINLRGLDAGATLVLIDGKRIAPSGAAGAFDDISNIPLSIIDHIDILPDGASSRYGADAVSGVVNFVTRGSFTGAQTQARGGGVTNGSMGERLFSQLLGNSRDSGNELLAFEYFQRDPLRAGDRSQYTSDLTAFGGTNFDTLYGSPGTIIAGNRSWAIPKGQNGMSLAAADLTSGTSNLYDQYAGTDVTAGEKRWSVFAKQNQHLTADGSLHFEGLFTRRDVTFTPVSSFPLLLSVPESNPFYVNPAAAPGPVTVVAGTAAFFGPTTVDNRIDSGNFSVALTMAAFAGWTANGYVSYAFERQHLMQHGFFDQAALTAALLDPDPATAFNPFGDGSDTNPITLASIRGVATHQSDSTLGTSGFTATGRTLALPGGDAELSIGAEYRIQDFRTTDTQPGENPDTTGSLSRNVRAQFAELQIPLVGEGQQLEFIRRLDVSLGVRHEDFSDVGGATIPKIGWHWSWSRDLSFRGTWTKSFKPPNLTDMIASRSQSAFSFLNDPSSPTGATQVLSLFGTNPNLRPESARSWTLGTDFTPQSVPGLSGSLTYFNIEYADRITDTQITPDVLTQPSFDWLFIRNVTPAQLADFCTHSAFQGSQAACLNSGVTTILDNRLRNIALLKTDGIDLTGRYWFENRAGRFDFGLNGTYLFGYSQSNTPDGPLADIVSTQSNPINLRARGSAAWLRRGLGVSAFVNFENGYRDTLSVPNRGVSAWTTIDLQLSYESAAEAPQWLGNAQFALNVQNLCNVNPPFLNNSAVGLGYDQENADLYGRMVSFEIRKRW
jgi:iron complex outermembrane recepter protein